MKVTLKKASEIARTAIAAGEKIRINSTGTISVFSDVATIPERIGQGRGTMSVDIQRATALIQIGFTIRAAIGAENGTNGVNKLLSEVAMLDKLMTVYSFIEGTRQLGYGAAVASDDISALIKRVERSAGSETTHPDVTVNLVNEALQTEFTDAVADLKRKRVALKDQITALNFTSHIVIKSADIAVLQNEKVI